MDRRKLTKEEKIAQIKRVREQRKLQEEQYQADVAAKAKRFSGPLGIILKVISVLVILGAVGLMADDSFEVQWEKRQINRVVPEEVEVIAMGGYAYHCIFYHVYLDEDEKAELDVHGETIQRSVDSGYVYLGKTPFYEDVVGFKNPGESHSIALYQVSFWEMTFPIIAIFFAVLGLIIKPKWNMQTLYLAYMNMVLMPLLFGVMSFHAVQNWDGSGYYEMNLNDPEGFIKMMDV